MRCSGAPRDLGRDQGSALRTEIRDEFGWSARFAALVDRSAGTRRHRELRRHFPHQSEWIEGMARAAGVSRAALEAGACAAPSTPVAAIAASASGTLRVACTIPPAARWRRVAPEGRFASVECSLPSMVTPICGVNEVGLAVVASWSASRPASGSLPVALFARDCLERFESVDPALEWCLSRPASPGGGLLLADAGGELAGVDAEGPGLERRALRPVGGVLGIGSAAALAKPAGDAEQLEVALAATLDPEGLEVVIVDPSGRRMRCGGDAWLEA